MGKYVTVTANEGGRTGTDGSSPSPPCWDATSGFFLPGMVRPRRNHAGTLLPPLTGVFPTRDGLGLRRHHPAGILLLLVSFL